MSDSNSSSKMGRFRNHQQGEVFDEAIETFFKFWKDGRPALLNFNTHDGRISQDSLDFITSKRRNLLFIVQSHQEVKPHLVPVKSNATKKELKPLEKRRGRKQQDPIISQRSLIPVVLSYLKLYLPATHLLMLQELQKFHLRIPAHFRIA